MSRLAAVLLAALLTVAHVTPANAQGRIVPRGCFAPQQEPMPRLDERRPRPMPMPCRESQIARTHVGVKIELVDRVLRYEVEERFVNAGGTVGEADYMFPMPAGAAFRDLKLSINGEMVSGETLPADEARRIYEEIVRRQRDPALVEWLGTGLLRTRIYPFNPGEERRIIVRYEVVAEREGDALRIAHRTGAAYASGGVVQAGDAGSTRARGVRRATGSLTLVHPDDARFGRAYSPTDVLTARDRAGRREVTLRGSEDEVFAALSRGVTILLPERRAGGAAIALLPHAPSSEDGFALLTLSPPHQDGRASSPRDVTLVLDVSGSMSGRKMEQARAAARQVLASLRREDRFRLVDFATEVNGFPEPGTRGARFLPASPANVRAAEAYVRDLEAAGSTNISGALEAALERGDDFDRLELVLFVTDGAPTVGERRPEAIARRAATLRGERRVFTFGVGADVNAALLEQLALEGRGTAHFVRPEESVEHAVGVVASRLVAPVATDIRVRVEPLEGRERGVRLLQMHPRDDVDLFAGQDLVLLSRYRGSGRARVVVEGRGRGGPVRWSTVVHFPEHTRENPAVARLWATQRVGWLAAEKRNLAHGQSSAELDQEIRALGERFGIPTEFTSYFVPEPGVMDAANRRLSGRADAVPVSPGVQRRGSVGQGVAESAPTAARSAPVTVAEQAFESARLSAKQREMRVASEIAADAVVNGEASRVVGSRRFVLRQGRWTDASFRDTLAVVRVAPWSPAYFELLRILPELAEAFALGDRVIVAGRAVAVELAPNGLQSLPATEARRLRERW